MNYSDWDAKLTQNRVFGKIPTQQEKAAEKTQTTARTLLNTNKTMATNSPNSYSDKWNRALNTGFNYNPFLKRNGELANKHIDYQGLLDNSNIVSKTKEYITQATGLKPKNVETDSSNSSNQVSLQNIRSRLTKNNSSSFDSLGNSGANTNQVVDENNLGNLDIKTELPKLTVNQIQTLISKRFSGSKVLTPNDAQAIYEAQQQSGMSALAMLAIGAQESGWGKYPIGNNIWGYGATNDNPSGNAQKYNSLGGGGAAQFATNFMKDYYDGYGAKTISQVGTGNNPGGAGYAYNDDGSISSSWTPAVTSIMKTLYNDLKSGGLLSSGSGTTSQASRGSASNSSSGGNSLVNSAKKYLGTPYVWGGTSPDGFDCSGLMQYVYKQNGINIGRTTYDQIKEGRAVSRDQLQPGDLVFFGTSSDPHHVGMYIGDGQYLHAPRTGDVVKISSLSSRSDYLTARRMT